VPKSHLSIAILSAVVITCIASSANPQKRRSQPAQQVGRFDISRETLPPNYQGFDVETVFKQFSLRADKLQKSEFETTEQHQQRLKQLDSQPLLGTVTATDLMPFTIEMIEIESEYNADAQSLQVAILTSKVFGITNKFRSLSSISLKGDFTDQGPSI
jgi:hypothetical protein